MTLLPTPETHRLEEAGEALSTINLSLKTQNKFWKIFASAGLLFLCVILTMMGFFITMKWNETLAVIEKGYTQPVNLPLLKESSITHHKLQAIEFEYAKLLTSSRLILSIHERQISAGEKTGEANPAAWNLFREAVLSDTLIKEKESKSIATVPAWRARFFSRSLQ